MRDWREDPKVKFGFLAPAIIYLLTLLIFPAAFNIYSSLHRWYMGGGEPVFIGAANYLRLFSDARFLNGLSFTLRFVVTAVLLEILLGLLLALSLNLLSRGRRIVMTLMLLPLIMAPIAVGYMWRIIYHADYGLVPAVSKLLGIPRLYILSDPRLSFWGMVVIDVWQWTPFVLLVLYAALVSLPRDPLEAALVDGASPIQRFRYVTLPLLTPIILIVMFLRLVEAFKVFDIIYITTGGGALTESLSLYIYLVGLKQFDIGYGGAAAWIFFLIVLMIVTVMMFRLRRYMGL